MSTDVKLALKFWELTAALQAETRWQTWPHGGYTRTLAFALIYARAVTDGKPTWQQVRGSAGWREDERGSFYLRSAIGEDAPRFEPPPGPKSRDGYGAACEAPMVRRDGPCGVRGSYQARITDPATGRWRIGAWCGRHRDAYDQAWTAEQLRRKAGTFPEPAPNTGGLLALYHPSRAWPDLYAWARAGWEPPALGLNPNDWPVLDKVHRFEPPKLEVLDGAGEAEVVGDDTAIPVLTLLRGAQ